MFEQFINRYIIEGELTAVTALHIGAAEDEFRPGGCKNPFFRNADGLPLIPGSSLKGAMRSFLEQYLSTDAGKELLLKDVPYAEQICSEQNPCTAQLKDEIKNWKKQKQNIEEKISAFLFGGENGAGGRLCMACRLFGSPYSAAKLSVRDARAAEDTFHGEFEIRSGVAIDRDLGISVQNKKFTTETVPQGTVFALKAVLENADSYEWEAVTKLLQAMELGMIQIGGMKSRGLGETSLKNIRYQYVDATNLAEYLSGEELGFKDFHEK